MKFGNTDNIDKIDLTIPPGEVQKGSSRSDKFYVYVGCANWNKTHLKGFFPKGIKDELAYYSRQFNSIELNATFYKTFFSSQIREWYERTPEGFMFFPKLTQELSHFRRLKDFEKPLDGWMESIEALDDKLGVIFFQAHNNFAPEQFGHFDRVERFVRYWSDNYKRLLAIEMRHTDWHNNKEIANKYYALLEEHLVANIIVDTPGRRDLMHMRLTTPTAFIRFVGCGIDEIDFKRLEDWAVRIGEWADKGLSEAYFFVHQHVERESPMLATHFIEHLNRATGLELEPPTLLDRPAPVLEP